jgi:hypothetical protein
MEKYCEGIPASFTGYGVLFFITRSLAKGNSQQMH